MYATSFYGSNLWDLFCDNTNKNTSWNTAIRILFNPTRQTHRYFIESFPESIHVKTMLCSRFVLFCDSLCKSPKLSIRLLYNLSLNDHRTVLCKNILNISCECNVERLFLNESSVKSVMKYADTPDNAWRIPLLKELFLARSNHLLTNDFNNVALSYMISAVYTDSTTS